MFTQKNELLDIKLCNGRALSAFKLLKIQAEGASYKINCPFPVKALRAQLPGVAIEANIPSFATQPALKPIPGIKNIIAVASGKGGVGKSTTAVNIALALQADGAQVGILDADIYGPSQPMMLGGVESPKTRDEKSMEPVEKHGLQTMSIGYLLTDDDQPVIWRGPMVSTALKQLLNDTRWHDLDYLIVDLPPGTGDIQLTLVQKIPLAGAVIVTTPQDIALLDAKKALRMFQKVNVPVLGVIENMSYHLCRECGHRDTIFGVGGGAAMESQYQVPLLGQLPLDTRIREHADSGLPTVVAMPESDLAKEYTNIARKMAYELALRPKNYATQFAVVVEPKKEE